MFEPSAQIESLLAAITVNKSASDGIRMMMQRQSEFDSPLAAQLTGIALDPKGRAFADKFLDDYWSDEVRRQNLLDTVDPDREVIIGSGFHAAVYAAVRVLSGFAKPLVLERHDRAGGIFAMTARPTFYLNSRNRAGNAGLAGDQGAALNFLPGAPIQAANVSMAEYQTNADMGLVIRLTLAQYADVVTNATVQSVTRDDTGVEIGIANSGPVFAARIIDARGLGDPNDQDVTNGTTILTFAQFMQRMASRWPLRGLRRVAVIGGGDSGKCTVEALLGIGPAPSMAAAALDSVERVDWYADELPTTCDGWRQEVRGRYQAIGRYLRPDRQGVQRLSVLNRRARPVALPGSALINGRAYDLVVVCTGNREDTIGGLSFGDFEEYAAPDGNVVARRSFYVPAFRVGPHARLPFTQRERTDGVADIAGNAVSMFRTATKTAALAATLEPATRD
ncbi:hypothetical protein Aca07nite_84470 [Actinoplanes capillaceus]|uniref:Uncharacterized protein n=1 Tax=Actinoplanes campanulatus TaxID=113559 RepID=A0ABQ3WY03_9ACTN|nr:hypothetical protein [Actinoplanes capillaceus]GID51172.1 hypothetical protein Aca07nite_84470 [Actinoplanes capillaceus]